MAVDPPDAQVAAAIAAEVAALLPRPRLRPRADSGRGGRHL
jgi:hypothetical protein